MRNLVGISNVIMNHATCHIKAQLKTLTLESKSVQALKLPLSRSTACMEMWKKRQMTKIIHDILCKLLLEWKDHQVIITFKNIFVVRPLGARKTTPASPHVPITMLCIKIHRHGLNQKWMFDVYNKCGISGPAVQS